MTDIAQLLGKEAEDLLQHRCTTIPAENLYLPGADFVDRIIIDNNRPNTVLRSMQTLLNHGRLAGTGYLSILPVDQGIEHSAGASFAANPLYFDPKNIVELAIEAGCNCVASTYGVLASVSRRYAHKIPFLVKLNHNETLSYPTQYDQTLYASVGGLSIWGRSRSAQPFTSDPSNLAARFRRSRRLRTRARVGHGHRTLGLSA